MTDAELQSLRDEILKVVVASIAAAKAEALAEADARILAATNTATNLMARAVVMTAAASNLAAFEIACAVVAALVERAAIDPARVVAWARWMATNQPEATEPAVSEGAANTLRTFAGLLEAMAKQRPDGPSARN
jgi:hypothetical protein